MRNTNSKAEPPRCDSVPNTQSPDSKLSSHVGFLKVKESPLRFISLKLEALTVIQPSRSSLMSCSATTTKDLAKSFSNSKFKLLKRQTLYWNCNFIFALSLQKPFVWTSDLGSQKKNAIILKSNESCFVAIVTLLKVTTPSYWSNFQLIGKFDRTQTQRKSTLKTGQSKKFL